MSSVKEVRSPRAKAQNANEESIADREDGCVLLGIEPSGKIAFCQIGDGEQNADGQVTDSMLERYPNLAYVAVLPASIQAVRSDAVRLNRPR